METIGKRLDSLIGNRFTENELNKKLSNMFNGNFKVSKYEREYCVKKELPELDDQFVCTIENDDIGIDIDLYYLIDNGKKYYITETNYESFL